uniref:Uncharacterized protein n=1 Tax=Anguilla anguilla TaxID=7936 RepID=A0A0E9WTI8_ANGAN
MDVKTSITTVPFPLITLLIVNCLKKINGISPLCVCFASLAHSVHLNLNRKRFKCENFQMYNNKILLNDDPINLQSKMLIHPHKVMKLGMCIDSRIKTPTLKA